VLWNGAYIANGGLTADSAETLLEDGYATATSFGRPFIANPDLVERFRNGWPISQGDSSVYYGGGAKGYTDFPRYQTANLAV
jgi:2,4-dienoyl-CoA reductase-like NADH-dependent reductase (Old Yellow Enzyme family)